MRKIIALLGVLVLVLAACGGGDGGSGLPGDDDIPDASGACLPDDPDCQDIGDPNADPGVPSDATDDPITPGSSLTIDQVLASGTIDGTFVVSGYLFVDADGNAVLCELILESYPPQCGGDSIAVAGEIPFLDELSTDQGLYWSDNPVELEGTFDGTTFTIG